jgi:transcriptional regulator with XRE-family HTH domain
MAQTTKTGLPTIGDVILAWRKFRGLRSTELVQLAGIKKGYLSALEHNKRATPQETYLAKLADALEVPLQDIYGRRMPPKDGAVVTTPSSKQGVAGQGSQQVAADEERDGEAEEEERASGTPTYRVAHPAISIRSLASSTIGGQIERLIASAGLPEEEEEEVGAALIKITKELLKLSEMLRKK